MTGAGFGVVVVGVSLVVGAGVTTAGRKFRISNRGNDTLQGRKDLVSKQEVFSRVFDQLAQLATSQRAIPLAHERAYLQMND